MHFYEIYVVFLLIVCLAPGHGTEIPNCNFEDTVELTNFPQFPNGSYLYENNEIFPDQVGIYDYEEIFDGQRIPRQPHARGCLCKERNCIKFCCHPDFGLSVNYGRLCQPLVHQKKSSYENYIEVLLHNGSKVRRNAMEDFTVVRGIPCENAYPLTTDEWSLLENGMLLRHHDYVILSKRDYCLSPLEMPDGQMLLTPLNCPTSATGSTKSDRVYNISGLISTPFIILSVLLYVLRPKLRNLRGKCIICCLTSLAVGNTILTTVAINDIMFSQLMCRSMGLLAYFFFVSSYMWLTVIGYDLWKNAKNVITIFTEKRRFLNYSEYAWGIPLVLTTILLIIGKSNIADEYKPNIDGNNCWLKTSNWSAMIYYFGLNAIILCLNLVFCFLTFCKEVPHLKKCDGFKRYISDLEESLVVYSLLLLVMGLSWCLKISAYFEEVLQLNTNNILLYLSESMRATEGPLIFFVILIMSSNKRRNTAIDASESPLMAYSNEENDLVEQPVKYADILQPLSGPVPLVITSQMR